jgi:hypothetical protein
VAGRRGDSHCLRGWVGESVAVLRLMDDVGMFPGFEVGAEELDGAYHGD